MFIEENPMHHLQIVAALAQYLRKAHPQDAQMFVETLIRDPSNMRLGAASDQLLSSISPGDMQWIEKVLRKTLTSKVLGCSMKGAPDLDKPFEPNPYVTVQPKPMDRIYMRHVDDTDNFQYVEVMYVGKSWIIVMPADEGPREEQIYETHELEFFDKAPQEKLQDRELMRMERMLQAYFPAELYSRGWRLRKEPVTA